MSMSRLKHVLAASAFALGIGSAQAVPSVGLYLTMDGSASIVASDFTTQVTAYQNALTAVFAADPTLYGRVAIGGGIFGGNFSEFFAVQEITDATVLGNLTAAIAGLDPGRGGINTGSTAIGNAITASSNALTAYETSLGVDIRLLIDVTTDGQNNLGPAPGPVANALVPSPLNAVNCLGIGGAADCTWVAGAGTNFGQVSFAGLEQALTTKLQAEFNAPEPGSLALLGLGLAGLAAVRRRKAQAA